MRLSTSEPDADSAGHHVHDDGHHEEHRAEEPDRAFVSEAELEEETVGGARGEHSDHEREQGGCERGLSRGPFSGS